MSEDERKAIELIGGMVKLTSDYVEDRVIGPREVKALCIILDLIDKQQKEIDFFRNNNCCFESTKQGLYAIQLIPENYVPKDKIKEKIEELKNRKIGASTGIFAVQVDILEELLGE